MMPSDSLWLVSALHGKKIKGAIVHSAQKEVLDSSLKEVISF